MMENVKPTKVDSEVKDKVLPGKYIEDVESSSKTLQKRSALSSNALQDLGENALNNIVKDLKVTIDLPEENFHILLLDIKLWY